MLCVCDGVAIPDNQTYITQHWLRTDKVKWQLGGIEELCKPNITNKPVGAYTNTLILSIYAYLSDSNPYQRPYIRETMHLYTLPM